MMLLVIIVMINILYLDSVNDHESLTVIMMN